MGHKGLCPEGSFSRYPWTCRFQSQFLGPDNLMCFSLFGLCLCVKNVRMILGPSCKEKLHTQKMFVVCDL